MGLLDFRGSDRLISEGVHGNSWFTGFTLAEAVGVNVLASEASGIETIVDPNFPSFSLDVFQE